MICPACGAQDVYQGLNKLECSNTHCRHFARPPKPPLGSKPARLDSPYTGNFYEGGFKLSHIPEVADVQKKLMAEFCKAMTEDDFAQKALMAIAMRAPIDLHIWHTP